MSRNLKWLFICELLEILPFMKADELFIMWPAILFYNEVGRHIQYWAKLGLFYLRHLWTAEQCHFWSFYLRLILDTSFWYCLCLQTKRRSWFLAPLSRSREPNENQQNTIESIFHGIRNYSVYAVGWAHQIPHCGYELAWFTRSRTWNGRDPNQVAS